MKKRLLTALALVSLFCLEAATGAPDEAKKDNKTAATKTTAADKDNSPPDMETIRKELEGLSREERTAKLKEYRERFKETDPSVPEAPQISAEKWKKMSSEDKSNYIRSLRTAQSPNQNTPEPRDAQLKQIQASIDRQIQSLQIRRKAGTITERESETLEKLLAQQKRVRGRISAAQNHDRAAPPPETPALAE